MCHFLFCFIFVVVQSLSYVQVFAAPWTAAHQTSMSFTIAQSLPKLKSFESMMPSNHLILLSPSPALNLHQHQSVFQRVGSSHQVAKVLELVLASVLLMNVRGWFPLGLTGLISLQSQGTLKILLRHHNSKAFILQHSAFLIVRLSHPYMTIGKTIAWTIQTFVSKMMSDF